MVLDVPVAEGLRRAGARAESNRYERMGTDFHERVREGFRARARAEPERFAVVDAKPDPESVERAILESCGGASPGLVR